MKDDISNLAERHNAEPAVAGPRVEVSAELLNDAVLQLRKLSGIRQREAERQERAIAQLHVALKRQSRLNRFVLLASTIAIAAALFTGYVAWRSQSSNTLAAQSLSDVEKQLAANNDLMSTDLAAARASQDQLAEKVEQQLQAVRLERDQVRGEVRNVLDEKTRALATQEAALQAEKLALDEARAKVRQEQQALIQETIERLNAMSVQLESTPAEDAVPENNAGEPVIIPSAEIPAATGSTPAQ